MNTKVTFIESICLLFVIMISVGFLLPFLFSARDWVLVCAGFLWMVVLGCWIYSIVRRLINECKEIVTDESN